MELTTSGSPGAQAAGGFATRRQTVAPARPWVSVVLMLCLAVVSPSPAWSAGAPRDTSTVLLLLQKAQGGSRVPLLLELAELRRSESGEGVRLTDEALRLLERHPSPELEVSARAARSYALQLRGDYRAALTEAEHAERIARETKKPEVIAKATYAVAFVEWRMANYAPALAKAQAARSLLEPAGPSPLLVRTISLQGAIQQSQSDLEPALRYYLACLSMADTLHDEIAMGRAHNNIGLVYWDLGRNNEAYAEFQRALAIHERLGPPENLANTLNNMGLILLELQRTREAIPYLERTLAIDQKAENPYGEAKSLSNLGGAYEQLKMWRRALDLHQQALAIRERIDDKEGIVRSLGTVASVRMQLGEPRAAIPLCERSIALAAAIGAPRDEADQLQTLANAYSALGDSGSALRAYRRYHQLETSMNDSLSRAHIAELDAGYRARERELELEDLRHEAESKRQELRRLMLGSVLLGGSLVLVGVLLILRVRSQRQIIESEQRYRALFHSSVVPTFLVDEEAQCVVDLNAAAANICQGVREQGRTPLAELEPEWVRRALLKVFEPGVAATVELEDSWSESSGRSRWTEVRGSAVSLAGRACRLVSVRDATERHAESEARQREEKLRSLGVLAGRIAHDFNNVLTAVVGHISLARDSAASQRDELLETAEKAAVGASRLTAQLLAFAKGGQPARRSTDLGRVLRESVALIGAGADMRIELEIPTGLWPAFADEAQLVQVVNSLGMNAKEATQGRGHLRIRASNFSGELPGVPADSRQRFVRVDFADDGPGIPEALRSRVFEPYFTTKSTGSGLGLTTAYTICRNHGGDLSVVSREGVGTTFSLFLPTAEEPPLGSEPESLGRPAGQGRILVLDDEPLLRDLLVMMLTRWGYTVEAVADGREAVRRYVECRTQGTPFDLLIMDLTIPGGMGGRQAFAEILAHDPQARAIVASGYSDDPIMADYRKAGFLGALAKPFQKAELARVVNALMSAEAGKPV